MKVHTDICIIGAGPVGLFAVFQAGLLKMICHIVDALRPEESQLATTLLEKQTYKTAENLNVSIQELSSNLREQIYPFNPGFTNGESIEKLSCFKDGNFKLLTNRGVQINCRAVVFIGQSPTLGSIVDCNVNIDHSIIVMNSQDYHTIIPGIFVIGDYQSHSDKIAAFIPGFIKASLVTQAAFRYIHPLKQLCFKSY